MTPLPPPPLVDVCIVGAGISGLAARRALRAAGRSTLLLEKSRGAGGRMATRRGPALLADLGAQFTAADPPAWAEALAAAGSDLLSLSLPGAEHPRFAHRRGLSALARLLLPREAEDVHFQQRAVRILPGEPLTIETEAGLTVRARRLLLTAPVPQCLALLDAAGWPEPPLAPLRAIEYDSCLALLARLAVPLQLPPPALYPHPTPGLTGIYDQASKGLETAGGTFVVHASPLRSRELWDEREPKILEELWREATTFLESRLGPLPPAELTLHRWRYCEPRQPYPEPFYALGPIVLAGDAFGRSSVAGAFHSGETAAAFLARNLESPPPGGRP